MPSSKPAVFVSSTVYDFGDLRSALKYQLEGLGFTVQMSEFADFEKPIEANSYDACFEAIRSSDAFVLLVGSRRGGWYDRSKRVSITQAEYRVAYEETKRRNLPIIACIRRSTWDHLAIARLAVTTTPGFTNPPTGKFIEDLEHLTAFLDELRRVEEMKSAIANGTTLPAGNWIHQFGAFEELVAALRVGLRVRRGVDAELLLQQVGDELAGYSSRFLMREKDGSVVSYFDRLPSLLQELGLKKTHFDDLMGHLTLSSQQVALLVTLALAPASLRAPLSALQIAVTSPLLAEYNRGTGELSDSPLQAALRRTLVAVHVLEQNEQNAQAARSKLFEECAGSRGSSFWRVKFVTVALSLGHALQAARVIAEVENVVAHLKFGALLSDKPANIPSSPIAESVASLEAKTVTTADFLAWTRQRAGVASVP